ncbi:MAG: type II toxin-antitoxin system PemK/MazF family toxin [Deltaproteobacteria bacterium]|nr:type II toxin-antitoxin system PemK/MazF family toxin [Deltaproteobacteria bacterium]
MVISQGEVWWADLGEPRGSEPAFRRPVLVIQGNPYNASRLSTVVCVALTSNQKWSAAPGSVVLSRRDTGLSRDSVANTTQLMTLDRDDLEDRTGRIPRRKLELVFAGIDVLLDR